MGNMLTDKSMQQRIREHQDHDVDILSNPSSIGGDNFDEHGDMTKTDTSDSEAALTSSSEQTMCGQLLSDITSCNKVPSILIELISSILAIITMAFSFIAYQEVSYDTTGIYYPVYAKNERVKHFDKEPNIGENPDTIHIYEAAVYKNWRNFAHLGLVLAIFELSGPLLRLIVITNRTPKRINTLHSLVQITLMTCLVLGDGAIALCKAMLFVEECGIRTPMMMSINKLSSSLSLVNALMKTTLFIWRSSFRNQRIPRDEMEQYTEILVLEEYQWYHCIIPILTHITVIGLVSWTVSQASNSKLTCEPQLF